MRPEYEIRGKYSRANREPAVVYFDYGTADLDAAEQQKIRNLVASVPQGTPITVQGFGSDDERGNNPADRRLLIESRMERVHEALRGANWTGQGTPELHLDNTDPEIEYRQQRRVQLRTNVVAIARDASTPDHQPAPQVIPDAITAALLKLRQAVKDINDGNAGTSLQRFFPGVDPRDVLFNLTRMEQQLAGLQEATPTSADRRPAYRYLTRNAGLASTSGSGSRMLMTFGPEIRTDSPVERAATVLHETSHGARDVETEDISYISSRLFRHLPGDVALRNADSYAFFILSLTDPGHQPSQPPNDTYDNRFSNAERRDVAEAVAYLECYLINARQDVRRLYRHAWQRLYRNVAWPGAYTRLLEAVSDAFPGHVHEPVRAEEDHTLAGIFERMTILTDSVRGTQLAFAPAQNTRWHTDTDTVEVSPRFFQLGRRGRARRLLQALVDATPSIDPNLTDEYVDAVAGMADAGRYGR